MKSPSPQPPEAQPLVFSHGAVLPASFLWMGCGWRGWSVPTRGALCHVQYTHPSEDAQAGLERLHRAISPWPGPAEPWNGLFPQLAPHLPSPRGIQGRELAPASGIRFHAPSAGAEDGTKGGLTVGAKASGTFRWPEGRAAGEGPPPVAPTSFVQPIQATAGDPRHFLPNEPSSLAGGGGRDSRAAGWG